MVLRLFNRLSFAALLTTVSAPFAASHAQAPAHTPAAGTPKALSLFTRLVGEWEGDAWMIMGPQGKVSVKQRETVEAVAGGTAFSVKGLGTLTEASGAARVVHDAFAIIYLDHDHTTPRMRAYVAAEGGNWLDPEFTLTADSYSWRMTDPRAGLIRYEMSFDAEGRWVEKGVMSRDSGKTWMPFFEMTLNRKK